MVKQLVLFDDQTELMRRLQLEAGRSKSILLQSPTGSGKTAMMLWLAMRTVEKKRKAGFFVPRKALLTQTSQSFNEYGLHHNFVASGKDYNPFGDMYLGMIDTMARRLKAWIKDGKSGPCPIPKVDLAIFDETHFGDDALELLINYYKSIGAWVIGPTATPWDMKGQGLGRFYDSMVMGLQVRELIDLKRLSNYKYFYGRKEGELINLSRATEKEIDEYMRQRPAIIGDAVRDYKLRCEGKIHLVRCTSIEHAQMTAEYFRHAGIAAAHVDGNMSEAEQMKIFMAYARRELKVLTFAQLLNFGFDLAQITGMKVCIESASDLKRSKSLAGQMQFWGRTMRYKSFDAIFNDHVNNWVEHGLPCSNRDWTLDSLRRKSSQEKVPATRQCPTCYFVSAPTPSCPECGLVYEVNSVFTKEVKGDLVEIDKAEVERKRLERQERYKCESLEDLIRLGMKRGYAKPTGWARKIWSSAAWEKKRQKYAEKQLQSV